MNSQFSQRHPAIHRAYKRVKKQRKNLAYLFRGRAAIFNRIYKSNRWSDSESVSGPGSNLAQTEALRQMQPDLFKQLGVNSILDIPCGDFYWMSKLDLGVEYTGADIVETLIQQNIENYANDGVKFCVLDLVSSPLPRADLIFCRDCLVHLSYRNIFLAIDNIKRSGAEYLMSTTFPALQSNHNIITGDWRPLNLERAPFNFPRPEQLIDEACPVAGYSDKSLGVWLTETLP